MGKVGFLQANFCIECLQDVSLSITDLIVDWIIVNRERVWKVGAWPNYVIVLYHVTIRVHRNRIQLYKMYRLFTPGRVKIIFFEKYMVRLGLNARFTVAETVGNTSGLVFFEFQQKTTFYRPKFTKRVCAL